MQKLFTLAVMLGLVAQAGRSDAQIKKHLSSDSSMIAAVRDTVRSQGVRDTASIQLSPVAVTAGLESSDNFSHLQPVAITGPDNFISGNLNSFVLQYIKNYYQDNTRNLQDLQTKSGTYFTLIEDVFDRFGIPEELKYLAVIESGLNTNARSRVGAVGTWQLMAGTARLLGLRVNRSRDERRDLYKSTIAAAKYLNELHDQFDNWLLVIAAYNCGPGGVMKAIDRSGGSTDFWDLKKYLPQESQKHVMKFLATAYILDRFASFFGVDKSSIWSDNLLQPVKADATPISTADMAELRISGKYSLPIIAKYTAMDINQLNRMNPGFDKMMSSASNAYDLKLPAKKMVIFKQKKNAILNESVELLMENNRQMAEAAYPAAKPLPVKPSKG
jgi:membrane-bound lytic murein transglycosylase D